MNKNRRQFLKQAIAAGVGMASMDVLHRSTSGNDQKGHSNRLTLDHAKATLEDGSVVDTPFWRIQSGRPGPSLALLAAQHGNEVQGTEVARRFQEICVQKLVAGSVWLVPLVNLPALHRRRHSSNLGPEEPITKAHAEGYNMNLVWPGNPAGKTPERIAHALDQAVLRHCTHLVDLHCWSHFTAAETLSTDHQPSRPLGEVTTTRFISYRSWDKLRTAGQLIRNRGGGAIEMELSGQFQIQERQVEIGLSSMVNVAKLLGLLEGQPEKIQGSRVVRDQKRTREIQAPCSGVFVRALTSDKKAMLAPDDRVEQGQPLGHLIRETDLATVPIVAPVSGYLWHFGTCHWQLCDNSLPAQHPYCDKDEVVARIVTM
jgi:uncharacterized protein